MNATLPPPPRPTEVTTGPDDGVVPPAARRSWLRLLRSRWALPFYLGGLVAILLFPLEGRRILFPRNFGVVEEGRIYRAGQLHRFIQRGLFEKYGIRTVVDLANVQDADGRAERRIAAEFGIEHHTMTTLNGGGTGEVREYIEALEIVRRSVLENKPVLVHCFSGSQRTGALIACYRMFFQGWSGAAAFDEYASYRKLPPSERLPNYLNENLPAIAQALVADGLLPELPNPLPVFGPAGSTRPVVVGRL